MIMSRLDYDHQKAHVKKLWEKTLFNIMNGKIGVLSWISYLIFLVLMIILFLLMNLNYKKLIFYFILNDWSHYIK